MVDTYKGSCFCGEVEFEVTGTPVVMGYCHCDDCTTWLAAPMSALSLWAPDSVRITKGEANVGTFALGQLETFAWGASHVRSWGRSRSNQAKSGHRNPTRSHHPSDGLQKPRQSTGRSGRYGKPHGSTAGGRGPQGVGARHSGQGRARPAVVGHRRAGNAGAA